MKKWISILLVLLSIYLAFGFALFFLQDSMMYHPTPQDFDNCPGFSEYEIIEHNSTRMYYLEQDSDRVIIHYHGNAGSTCDRSLFKSSFEKSGASIIFVEYAGYSNDEKNPSKELLLQDVENVVEFSDTYLEKIIYGQSLGAAVASYQGKIDEKVDTLILVSSFSSAKDVAQSIYFMYPISLLLKENYNPDNWLKNYSKEIGFYHGREDSIINPKFSKKLYESLETNNKTYIEIDNVGHNDLWISQEFREDLEDFLKE